MFNDYNRSKKRRMENISFRSASHFLYLPWVFLLVGWCMTTLFLFFSSVSCTAMTMWLVSMLVKIVSKTFCCLVPKSLRHTYKREMNMLWLYNVGMVSFVYHPSILFFFFVM